MAEQDNAYWFLRMAEAVRDIIKEHGGAIVMTRPELIEAIVEEDSGMGECPDVVFEHLTCGLRRKKLGACSYRNNDPDVLLIFDTTRGEEYARNRYAHEERSEAVELYLLDAR